MIAMCNKFRKVFFFLKYNKSLFLGRIISELDAEDVDEIEKLQD